MELFKYIETFYNRRRRGYLSLDEYEKQHRSGKAPAAKQVA